MWPIQGNIFHLLSFRKDESVMLSMYEKLQEFIVIVAVALFHFYCLKRKDSNVISKWFENCSVQKYNNQGWKFRSIQINKNSNAFH